MRRRGQKQALCSPSRELFIEQRAEWERIVLEYIGWKIENRIAEEDDPLIDFYFKLVKFTNMLAEQGDEFAHIIERTPDGLKSQDLLQGPVAFPRRDLRVRARHVALSATLEPFDFYRKTLGFPPDRTAELSLPSPFPREQPQDRRRLRKSTPRTSGAPNHYDRIAETVAEIAEAERRQLPGALPELRVPARDRRADAADAQDTSWCSAAT